MKQYLDQVSKILKEGEKRSDRTGVGTLSIFGMQTKYDLREGFPLVTTKKVNFSAVVKELLWFLRGETNINTLGCKIWDEWADESGELGPIYGKQWRAWQDRSVDDIGWMHEEQNDQIGELIERLKTDPMSRRHIVSAWNVNDLSEMALAPCHTMFQCYASEIPNWVSGPKYYLDLQLYQRSADMALGVPFNIASYALLLTLLAREVNMVPRFFIHTTGDAHIYLNHIDGLTQQIEREPLLLPKIEIANKPLPYPGCPRDGSVLEPDDIVLVEYNSHLPIKFEVAV